MEILLKDGQVGLTYISERGHKITLLRIRPESNEPVVHIVSTGHDIVLPADTKVIPDDSTPVVVPQEDVPSATRLLAGLVLRLYNDAGYTPESIADLAPISPARVEAELRLLTEASGGGILNPYAAASTPPVG